MPCFMLLVSLQSTRERYIYLYISSSSSLFVVMDVEKYSEEQILYDEATDELISPVRQMIAVEVVDKIQVMNILVEDLKNNVNNKIVFNIRVRLCYRYRKQLKIALLGSYMKITTVLDNANKHSLKVRLQRRLDIICEENYCISIRMFFCNLNYLLRRCKWITSVEDVRNICTLWHMDE
uniref:U1 protein n=1 Tax=Parsley severe stunt associated virus TaxID=2558055 RepID=A0A6G7BND7_9VIRU|nr:U1 protein [Parsley severe stunt associated virus]